MMKNYIWICLISVAFLLPWGAQAQVMVSGRIVDGDGNPLPGATVVEDSSSNGAAANLEGEYSIRVKGAESKLTFSFIGYKPVTEVVGARTVIDVVLKEDEELLDDVVITALGFEENKDQLGYANSKVKGQRLTQTGEPTLLNSLSGQASGVRISRNSGDPGAGAYIQIRGLSTITRDGQPLIVIDGVPISNDVRGNSDRGGVNQESRLNDLNPNDIESMTVLKGASAAALWGTRALGGAIIIKTKSGKYNSKLKVQYKTTYSLDRINRRYPLQTAYGQGDGGVFNARARDSWGDRIADRPGGADDFDTSGEFYVGQDGRTYYPILNKNSREIYDDSNFDQIFQDGQFWENSLSLTGGGKKNSVFFSLSDMNQEGIIINNSAYRRSTARFNLNQTLNDWLDLKLTSNYSRTQSNRILKGANSSGLYLGLLRTPADFDNTGYRGDYYASPDAAPIPNRHRSYREPLGADATATYNNPSWTINEQENLSRVNRFINTFQLTASPLAWLDLIGRVGIDHYSEKRNEFFTPGSAAGAYRTGFYEQSIATNTIFNMDYIAKARHEFSKDLTVEGLVGFNYNTRSRDVNGVNAVDFIQFVDVNSVVRDKDNALPENITTLSSQGIERTAGLYSSLTVSALEMFYFTGTLRGEAASTFGDEADNTFFFPSASLAWQFTGLDALHDNPVLSFGKLRLSYGEVGVQPGRYNTSNVFVSPSFGDQFGGSLSLGLFGNGGFVSSAARGNSTLLPERKKEFEIGADLRFLKDRLGFSVTYFDNTTEDVLLDFPVANSRGYSQVYANGATISNKGWEMDLRYTVLKKGDWQVDLTANFTTVDNLVEDLRGVESVNLGGLDAVSSRAVEGHPIGVLWGSRTLRGDDGSIVLDDNGFPVQDEVEGVIGDPNPDWQGALRATVRFKQFRLNAFFETFQGADIYAGTKSVLADLGRWESTANQQTATRNLREYNGDIIFIGETFRGNIADFGAGPVALTEAWYNGDGGFFGNGNDELYVEDGSWTRLRELSLSYLLEHPWLKDKGFQSVQFTFTGRNLILWAPFEGNDPDTNLSGISAARGIDYFNNPGTKSYIFSALFTF